MGQDAKDLLNKLLEEKAAEEAAEPTPEINTDMQRNFYKKWTMNGKHLITRAGGNFWMRGGNRSRCTIIKPAMLRALVQAGILKPEGSGYGFVKE